jgi:hypothetical protein
MARVLSAEALLAGASAVHTVDVPTDLLGTAPADDARAEAAAGAIKLRPLTLKDVQRITQAAKDGAILTSVLMVQQSLVEPRLTIEQVSALPAGLGRHLLEAVNRVSGIGLGPDDIEDAVKAPLARACFTLSKEFGWTPAECAELTIGQALLYLEMLARGERPAGSDT